MCIIQGGGPLQQPTTWGTGCWGLHGTIATALTAAEARIGTSVARPAFVILQEGGGRGQAGARPTARNASETAYLGHLAHPPHPQTSLAIPIKIQADNPPPAGLLLHPVAQSTLSQGEARAAPFGCGMMPCYTGYVYIRGGLWLGRTESNSE